MIDRLLTVAEVADRFRISRYTARQWARDGKLPAFHLGSSKHSQLRFRLADVEAAERTWLKASS